MFGRALWLVHGIQNTLRGRSRPQQAQCRCSPSPGLQDTPPPMYNVPKQGGSGSKLVTLLLLALRTLTFVFGIISLAILAADKATYYAQPDLTVLQFNLTFTIFAAYK